MNFEVIYQSFLEGIYGMSWLESVAAIFGAVSVICSLKNSIWLYPTGLVSTGIYVYLLSLDQFKLYAEATMNLYYFIMSVYGWYHWARKSNTAEVSVEWTTGKEWIIASLIVIIGWGTFYYLLKTFSNSDVPLVDSFVSATACSGMWLLAKRKIENWLVLNVSNLVAIPLLFHKKLISTAVLTIFLFIVAVFGYFSWQRIYKKAV